MTDEKKIDESWKEAATKDKNQERAPNAGQPSEAPVATFGLFISGLMMEALIALGELEHPISKKKEVSLDHAKFIIDTLAMLQEKTKNNLTPEEGEALEAILYDLRMRFLKKGKAAA